MQLNVDYFSEKMVSRFLNLLSNDIIYSCLDKPKDKAEVIRKIANDMIKIANDLSLNDNQEWKN